VLVPGVRTRITRFLGLLLVLSVVLVGTIMAAPDDAIAAYQVCTEEDVFGNTTCTTHQAEEAKPGDPPVNAETGLTPSPPKCLDRQEDKTYREIPCAIDIGWWSNAEQCYIRLADPQLPLPAGLNPEGAWYDCNPAPAPTCDPGTVCRDEWSFTNWYVTPPPGVPNLTPGQAARSLISSFELEGITVGFAPDPNVAGSRSYVGVPIWMWAADPTPLSFGPYVESSTLGAVTITATAQVTSVIWNMGDGTTVTCAGGTPFVAAFGAIDSPNCGHRYGRTSKSQPGGRFPVTATSQWQVSWEGGGESGVVSTTTSSTSSVQINEIQSVNVGAGG
jgi:hypothetical protein